MFLRNWREDDVGEENRLRAASAVGDADEANVEVVAARHVDSNRGAAALCSALAGATTADRSIMTVVVLGGWGGTLDQDTEKWKIKKREISGNWVFGNPALVYLGTTERVRGCDCPRARLKLPDMLSL